jgi:hypothetical protein
MFGLLSKIARKAGLIKIDIYVVRVRHGKIRTFQSIFPSNNWDGTFDKLVSRMASSMTSVENV